VIGEAWAMYRAHWRHFITIAFVVYLGLSLLTLLLVTLVGALGLIGSWFISLVGIFWLQGALVEAVADVRDGRADLTVGQTLARVRPRLNVLSLAGFLAVLGIGVGLVLLVVPGLVLLTWWILIVPAIMLEGRSVLESFGRSRELVAGRGWRVFGVIVLTFALTVAAWIVVALVLSPIPAALQGFLTSIIGSSVTAPIAAVAWTLMYYRLRVGREPAAA
jgi:hypothetical protein